MPGSKKRGRLTQHGETPPEAAIRDEDSRTESVTTESIAEQSSANGSRCLADLFPSTGKTCGYSRGKLPKTSEVLHETAVEESVADNGFRGRDALHATVVEREGEGSGLI